MTKVKKLPHYPKYRKLSFQVKETILTTQPKCMPTNLAEEKQKFIQSGNVPQFKLADPAKLKAVVDKTRNHVRFNLQGEAVYILEHVLSEYGDGEIYLGEAFGRRISKEDATPLLLEYITENCLSESLTIHWCDNLSCSAKMMWKGPLVNCNRPDLRKYSLWINGSDDNNYMRESGIRCLMDHEIGTHFFRMLNDGFQPWFSDREKFGLRRSGTFESKCTEEGLATINTVLRGRVKLLWSAAFAYYTACKSAEMTFKELFEHIGRYTSNKNYRWKQVMRVKRGLVNPNSLGGFGNDQCYFEGAVAILRNMDNIDFLHLMSGKVCYDEVDRIKRVIRKGCLRFPFFMHKIASYRKTLKKICALNGLDKVHDVSSPLTAELKLLAECKSFSLDSNKNGHKDKTKSETAAGKSKQKKLKNQNSKSSNKNDYECISNDQSEACDVESFKICSDFAHQLQHQQEEAKREAQTCQIYKTFESVTNELTSLGNMFEQKISVLRSIVKDHNWSNSDIEYKKSLLNQVSCELKLDAFPTSEEEAHAVLALATKTMCPTLIEPKTILKPPKNLACKLKHKKKKSLRLSEHLDFNTNNCPSRFVKRKSQNSVFWQGKQENSCLPKVKRRKKAEVITDKMVNEKVSNMKAQFVSDVKPHEIIYLEMSDLEDDEDCDTLHHNGVTVDINEDITTTMLPQINGAVNNDVSMNAKTGFSTAEQQENKKLSRSSSLDARSRKVPNFILRNKLLTKRSSMDSKIASKQEEIVDKKNENDSDSDSDDYKSRRSNFKKDQYAHIVSQYAQFKPRIIPKVKTDKEMLVADMCKPFFIQAERLLQAQKVLKKTKSGCRQRKKNIF